VDDGDLSLESNALIPDMPKDTKVMEVTARTMNDMDPEAVSSA
jgi:hypothetical protein